jgi:hypothetical protein
MERNTLLLVRMAHELNDHSSHSNDNESNYNYYHTRYHS